MKKITAILLVIIMSLSLTFPAFAAGFTDIRDEPVMLGAESLRMLGVISGVGDNRFDPDGLLTRAAFCKMTVLIQRRGADADSYMKRTIFPDVRADHWARGYINLMSSSAAPLLRGYSDGTFRPDTDISFAQAVTILMRVLGYADADTGMQWPDGYLALASVCGLTKGLDGLAADGPLTRAQAVTLFVNLLSVKQKSGTAYITTVGTTKDLILFKYKDDTLYTSEGEFKTAVAVPECFYGKDGTLVLNSEGKAVTFLADGDKTEVGAVLSQIQASWIVTADGMKYTVSADTKLYVDDKTQTYSTYWVNLLKGSGAVLYVDTDGKLDLIYCSTPAENATSVIKNANTQSVLAALTKGAAGYTVIKNGLAATASDAKLYDVAVYNADAKVLTLTDKKLTGCYENAYPNTTAPQTISVLGTKYTVLESALSDLTTFNIGDEVTLLLTADNQVAGVLPSSVYKEDAVGILTSYTNNVATAKLSNGLAVSGKAYYTPSDLVGELVIIRSYKSGTDTQLSVSKLSGNASEASLDVAGRRIGTVNVSKNVKVYERIGNGKPQEVDYDDITQAYVTASKIAAEHVGSDGDIDVLVLDNVTGDLYTYGFLSTKTVLDDKGTPDTSDDRTIKYVYLDGAAGTVNFATNYQYTNGAAGGVAVNNSENNTAYVIELQKAANIGRSAFTVTDNGTTVKLPLGIMPVSDKVACYNSRNGKWFASLDEARAFSDKLTCYYDRMPQDGGKVRLVVVE